MSSRRVVCATYNGKLARGRVRALTTGEPSEDLTGWLALDDNGVPLGRDGAPEFVAVGFQEMIPLHLALAGFTKTALDLHNDELLSAIDARFGRGGGGASPSSEKGGSTCASSYRLVAREVLGGITLLVYARADVAQRVQRVSRATAACGVFGLMGNKGAVGVRVTLREDGVGGSGKGDSVWTFVSAHFAAHQGECEARNADWREICRRLVFEEDAGDKGLFDTGHLFFFGDLNYRISLTSPKKLPLHLLSHGISSLDPTDPSTFSTLLAHDQLRQEQRAGRTLHHLSEGAIAFPPTYKFKPGSVGEYKDFRKRVPGWCDRVLYASAAGDDTKVESYRSVMEFTRSDHKPVAATISIPSSAVTARLAHHAPYALDRAHRLKRAVGTALDRLVGALWCLVMLAGLNRDLRLGFFNLALASATAYYRRYAMP
ncbi:hypothetical protein JCM3770_003728 [Rhodotorula araucariae]